MACDPLLVPSPCSHAPMSPLVCAMPRRLPRGGCILRPHRVVSSALTPLPEWCPVPPLPRAGCIRTELCPHSRFYRFRVSRDPADVCGCGQGHAKPCHTHTARHAALPDLHDKLCTIPLHSCHCGTCIHNILVFALTISCRPSL